MMIGVYQGRHIGEEVAGMGSPLKQKQTGWKVVQHQVLPGDPAEWKVFKDPYHRNIDGGKESNTDWLM